MQGSLLYIPCEPAKARRLIYLSKPPTQAQIRVLVGGTSELVPELETIQEEATIHPCLAFCRDTLEAQLEEEPRNQRGNLLWEESLARKYKNVPVDPGAFIHGPLLILSGDEEFLEAL